MSEDNTSSEYGFLNYDLEFSTVSWNTSDYINFSGPLIDTAHSDGHRIFIDDSDPSRNWSVHVQNYTWCTGSGIFSDPYVIENLYIDGNGTGGMIYVKYSDKFFIIKDCWFDFSGSNEYDAGVVVQVSENGMIVDNSFTYTSTGVTLESCSNFTVDNNIFISDQITVGLSRALSIGQGDSIVISNNKVRDYLDSFLWAYNSDNLTISGNYLESTVFEDYIPLVFNHVNDSEIIMNVFAGAFAVTSTFVVDIHSGIGNNVYNNIVGAGDTWIFGPETAGVSLNSLHLSQGSSRQIWLIDSSHNLIANNVLHGFIDQGGAIPGFDIFILMGMFGLISVLFLVVKRRRQ